MRFFRLDDDHPMTGWHMLAMLLAFFGVVIAVNIALAVAATGTFPGLVVENSYVASQHYDEMLAKARAQDAENWRYSLASEGGRLRVSLARGDEEPLRGLRVVAYVGRPSTTEDDRTFELAPASDGSYVTNDPLPAGLWEVDVEAARAEEILFRTTKEIYVRPMESGQ